MDGITAIFRSLALELASDGIETMKRAISHCGPDDGGIVYLTGSNIGWEPCSPAESSWTIALVSRRISIQDLSQAGHMPMRYQGRYWIVYNGEIYNSIEIRIGKIVV